MDLFPDWASLFSDKDTFEITNEVQDVVSEHPLLFTPPDRDVWIDDISNFEQEVMVGSTHFSGGSSPCDISWPIASSPADKSMSDAPENKVTAASESKIIEASENKVIQASDNNLSEDDVSGDFGSIWEALTPIEELMTLVEKVPPVFSDGKIKMESDGDESDFKKEKFLCEICNIGFTMKSALKRHMKYHSEGNVCERCNKVFSSRSSLSSHRKTHQKVKNHVCAVCGKSFHQKGNLRSHIYTHTNERPFKCAYCDKGFNQLTNLRTHVAKIHETEQTYFYKCLQCNATFARQKELTTHLRKVHDSVYQPQPTTILQYIDTILTDPINTHAMHYATSTQQTPFAVMHPLKGRPKLVRVITLEDKQLLVEATGEDMKRYGEAVDNTDDQSGVLARISIVARIFLRKDRESHQMYLEVVDPDPGASYEFTFNMRAQTNMQEGNPVELHIEEPNNNSSLTSENNTNDSVDQLREFLHFEEKMEQLGSIEVVEDSENYSRSPDQMLTFLDPKQEMDEPEGSKVLLNNFEASAQEATT